MTRTTFTIALLSICLSLAAQIPSVPSRMELGDMKIIITESGKKDIAKDVKMLRSSDRFFKIKLDRAALYMPIIERILKEEKVPDEVKYLAIQESALISDAVSASKAVGFWQFKDFTGREVGMRVDKKIDERKNIVSSTYGAARYFKNHQKYLDNWANTVTAHMTGLGGIKKYAKPKDKGAKKMTITSKSHWYLKRFLAHVIAFQGELDHKNSKGLSLIEYKKGAGKDLAKIAKEFKVEKDLLAHYNKWLLHGKIPNDKKYTVIIPVTKKDRQAQAIARKEAKSEPPRTSTRPTYQPRTPKVVTKVLPKELKPGLQGDQPEIMEVNGVPAILVRPGDNLNSLLARAGITQKQFLKFNELTTTPVMAAGDRYFIKKKKKTSRMSFYTVKEGQTLWEVSHQFGLRKNKLASLNRMSVIDDLKPGRVLWLSKKRPSGIPANHASLPDNVSSEAAPVITMDAPKTEGEHNKTSRKKTSVNKKLKGKLHTVASGETLWGISKQYEVTVDDLRTWNGLSKYDPIKPGQQLSLSEQKEEVIITEEPKRATKVYVVQPGDTLYQIAKSHEMGVSELIDLNNKKDSHIDVGEKLRVYK